MVLMAQKESLWQSARHLTRKSMEFRKISPAREFPVGNGDIVISHCANLILDSDEQVTFLTGDGKEYDVVRKPWGY